jgi:hypothetical protein
MRHSIPVLLLAVSLAIPGEITVDFVLDQGSVTTGSSGGMDVVQLTGGFASTPEGTPSLPGLGYMFVIPQGCTVDRVDVEPLQTSEMEGRFELAPVTYVPVSSRNAGPAPVVPGIYESDESFPASPVASLRNGNRTGFRLCSFVLVPFVYRPLSGRLSVMTEARITLHYEADNGVRQLTLSPRQVDTARSALECIVDNPWMLGSWAPAIDGGTDGPAWVVVADSSLQSALEPLVTHRSLATGPSAFVSLQWIYENYTGLDTQEQIRNFLKSSFSSGGLVYALIVGNFGETNRISWLEAGGSYLQATADLYYSDLDYNWDGDYDGLYGEIEDELDYYSDIYVGRFSSDLESDIELMVDKTIMYETGAPLTDWRTSALFCGAGLWPTQGYWGSFVCDSLAARLPAGWTVYKLYEDEYGHPDNQIDIINAGVSYMTPQGHGNSDGAWWYYGPVYDMITNNNYGDMTNGDMLPVYHSMACLSGRLQASECVAENLMNHPDGGGIAVFFNSNFGWGSPPNMGPSEVLECFFADMLFENNQNELGVTNALAKDELVMIATSSYDYWVVQENNMLGDPALLFAAGQNGLEGTPGGPMGPAISAPRPNPFPVSCLIPFTTDGGDATIAVYDISGRMVRTLHAGTLPAGEGSVVFDGTSDSGNPLPTGCYTAVLTTGSGRAAARMILVR